MAQKRNIPLSMIPLALAAGLVGGIFIGNFLHRTTLSPGQAKLQTVLGLIDRDYVDPVSVDSLLESAIPGLLSSLDPHSTYIPAEDLTDVNSELEGAFSGVGVSFQIMNDTVYVVEVIAGGPAEKVGILTGDRIVGVSGFDLTGANATNENVYKHLRGKDKSKADLTVVRPGAAQPLKFDVIRGEVPVHSVDSKYMLSDQVGYIRVSKFNRNTYQEFLDALLSLMAQGAADFVIDLRGNAGGYMDQAIYMANEFLPEDRLIVYTDGRSLENQTRAVSDGRGGFRNAGLVVLTDEYSASASEIFAGAIQDNDRGLVIGRRTFGKGLVQNQTTLPDSSAIRLTVARYFTPSGRSIQKEYTRGNDGKYQMDLVDRFSRGEMYHADSIRLDKSKLFHTRNGREVFGGGGIMPDVFVPEDTVGVTSYYMSVANKGLLQKFAMKQAEKYRSILPKDAPVETLLKFIPRDQTLLQNFVAYAASQGVPARWYYINQSRQLILGQLKSLITRDVLGYEAFIKMLNDRDPVVKRALEALQKGESPVDIPATKTASGSRTAKKKN